MGWIVENGVWTETDEPTGWMDPADAFDMIAAVEAPTEDSPPDSRVD